MDNPEAKVSYSDSHSAFHSLLVGRIYHEDNLFTQRTYALLTVHAFLLTGFTVLVTSEYAAHSAYRVPGTGLVFCHPILVPMTWLVGCPVSLFGALLGLFQAHFGRQTGRAISAWRTYLWMVEKKWEIPFDYIQYDFYSTAKAETPFGNILKSGASERSLYESLRIFPRFTAITTIVGTLLPAGMSLSWAGGFCLGIFEILRIQWLAWVFFGVFTVLEVFILTRPIAVPHSEIERALDLSD